MEIIQGSSGQLSGQVFNRLGQLFLILGQLKKGKKCSHASEMRFGAYRAIE